MSNVDAKYVFVCGLHRSGTTILGRQIGNLRECTAFENTGVDMDEGQYLQDVYPTEDSLGGPGSFGLKPQAHLTEASPLLTPANITRLHQAWEAHWDRNKAIRVEKTPANLLKTRFLQAAFENAYFVVIKRHPVAVSLATQRWTRYPLHRLFEHWLHCHGIYERDKRKLTRLYELRYEDYIANPDRYIREIAAFIGTEPPASPSEEASEAYNAKYLNRWAQMLPRFPLSVYYRHIAAEYEERFAAHGYSLADPKGRVVFTPREHSTPSRCAAGLLHIIADVCAFPWRKWGEVKWRCVLLKERLIEAGASRRTSGSGRSPGPAVRGDS